MDKEEIVALVEKAKNDDQSAIAQLYEATSKAVYFTALKIVGNPSDAEDIAQDTYVTAISKLSDLKENATFPKWIKIIAANTAKNYLTKKKPMLFSTDEDEEAALGSIPEASDEFIPDAAADKKETCRLVSEMIDNLPEKQRTALIMFYYDDMTISEIAEAMETNDNTIKSRLNYAQKYIKDEVEALAKKGTKLYGIAGVPLIAFVLNSLATDTAVPVGIATKVAAAGTATAVTATTAVTAASTTAATTTTTAATVTTTTTAAASTAATGVALGTSAKVAIAAVTSVAVIGGGVAIGKVTYPVEEYATIEEDHVGIYPAEVWREGEKFVVNCMVTNGFDVDKIITSIPHFLITDVNYNGIANASFDSVDLTVPAGDYVMHTFVLSGEALTNTNADYTDIGWDIGIDFDDVSVSAEETTEEAVVTEEITKMNEALPAQEETDSGKVTAPMESYAAIKENRIDIYPTEVWYEGEQFVANCMVTNGFDVDKIITSIPQFIIADVNFNGIANASFDSVDLTVPAGNYVMHTFTFSGEALTNTNADITDIYSFIGIDFCDVPVPAISLTSATQTVTGESYSPPKREAIIP